MTSPRLDYVDWIDGDGSSAIGVEEELERYEGYRRKQEAPVPRITRNLEGGDPEDSRAMIRKTQVIGVLATHRRSPSSVTGWSGGDGPGALNGLVAMGGRQR